MKLRPITEVFLACVFFFLISYVVLHLGIRWGEEKHDRAVALMVDWGEVRDLAARQSRPTDDLLSALQTSGVSGLVVYPLTLQDLALQQRIRRGSRGDSLMSSRILFSEPLLADQVFEELSARQVRGLHLSRNILSRVGGDFSSLRDIDVGFDPALILLMRQKGLVPVYRVRNDPWLSWPDFNRFLYTLQSENKLFGFFLSSDDLPGGLDVLPLWQSWIQNSPVILPFFEFHPPKGSVLVARTAPSHVYRAHTIPLAELKDLDPETQRLRWLRAVTERSCRLLLVHVSPAHSADSFLAELQSLRDDLVGRGFSCATFPGPRTDRPQRSPWFNLMLSFCSLFLSVVMPSLGLYWSQHNLVKKHIPILRSLPIWWRQFLKVSFITLLGAGLLAVLSDRPAMRLGLETFRGIKVSFVGGWILALGILYSREEIRHFLRGALKRWELIVGVLLVGVVGYLVVRSGNAPAAWKHPWEQHIREWLEACLVARPRFKEFAMGHPLLLLGFFLQDMGRKRSWKMDARPFLWAGMIGQLSMMNTFCHLHSPLFLEMLRTWHGLWIGFLIAFLASLVIQRWQKINP